MIGWLFVAALAGALVCLSYAGWWRYLPAFLSLLLISSAQAFSAVLANPYDRHWQENIWWPWEWLHLTVAVAAVGELIWRQTALLERPERRGLRIGIPVLSIAAVRFVWSLPAGTPYERFMTARTFIWGGLAFALTCLVLFFVVKPKRTPFLAHRWLLWGWMMVHATIAPLVRVTGEQWCSERTVYRLVVIGLCVGWSIAAQASARDHAFLPARGERR